MSTPAVEIRSFAVTIPAGTTKAAPLITPVTLPPRVVTEIHWRVPPGPSGLMGWKLTMSGGQAVLPTNGQYIITDDRADVWPVADQPDSGAWEVTGYNTDFNDHTVYLDFFLQLVGQPAAVSVFLPNDALSSPQPVTTPAVLALPAASLPVPPPASVPAGFGG